MGGPVRLLGVHQRAPVSQVERVDHVRDALVQVDRAGVQQEVRRPAVDGAEQAAGGHLHHAHRGAALAAQVDLGAFPVPPVPAGGPLPQRPRLDQRVHRLLRTLAEQVQVGRGERGLVGGAGELRREHVRVGRVEHRRLDRPPEQCLRVVHQVGVERVVPRHQYGERLVAGAPGPPGLLPQRRAGAGPAADQHRVQPDQVDAEFERVRGGEAEQVAVQQRPFQLAAFLAQVAGPVGGHPVAQPGHRLVERPPGVRGDHLGAPAGPYESERAYPLDHAVGEQVGGLPQRRAPDLDEVGVD